MISFEKRVLLEESSPERCTYCNEEKDFLFVEPAALSFKGNVEVTSNNTNGQSWVCLTCFENEISNWEKLMKKNELCYICEGKVDTSKPYGKNGNQLWCGECMNSNY